MPRSFLRSLLIALVLLAFAQPAFALYQWVDDKGLLHITDDPPPEKYAPKEKPAPVDEPAPAPAPAAAAPVSMPAMTAAVTAPAATAPQTAPSATVPRPVPGPAAAAPAAPQPPIAKTPPPLTPKPKPSPFASDQEAAGTIAALVGGFMMILLAVTAVFYVYYSFCLYRIAQKANFEAAWAAWVPVLQIWPFLGAAGKPIWWLLLLFIPLVNLFVMLYLWMCICENLGKNKWLGLLMLIDGGTIILPGYLAFSK